MLKGIAILALVAAMADHASAQQRAVGYTVSCEGCSMIASTDIEKALRFAVPNGDRTQRESRMRETVLQLARARGMYFARIDSFALAFAPDSATAKILLRIHEGAQVLHGSPRLEGCTAFPNADALRAMEIPENGVFVERDLADAISRLLVLYERSGYPLASASVRDVELRRDGDALLADAVIEVIEAGRWTIDDIEVQGNTDTDAEVVIRETRITRGDVFDASLVSAARSRIERLQFFSRVAEPEFTIRNGRGGLLLRVVEGSTNVFDGVIGYQPPRAGGGDGYLTGLVNVSFRNLFGTGRRFDGRWERATQSASELDLRYLEPWLLNLPFTLQGGFFERRQDSSYIRRSLDGRVTWLAGGAVQLSGTLQHVSVIPGSASTIAGLTSSSSMNGGAELLIDTRDNVYNPRSGVLLRNSYTGGSKRFSRAGSGERVNDFLQRIEMDVSYHLELFPRNIAALSAHGRDLRGDEIDASDLYRLGGANSLRGYREEQFSGTRLGWLNLEYRFSFGPRSFIFAFFDVGAVYQSPDPARERAEFTATRNGYGLGARIETGLGVIGVSYALGQGDGLSNGKIHFGLVNEF